MNTQKPTEKEIEATLDAFIAESPNLHRHFYEMDKALLVREMMRFCLRERNRAIRLDEEVLAYLQERVIEEGLSENDGNKNDPPKKSTYRPTSAQPSGKSNKGILKP